MDRHFAQTQDCVCRKFALTEHTTGIGRDHPERKSDAPPRFGRTPYRTQAPTTAEKHTVTYTRRPIIRYTLKSASDFPVRAVRSGSSPGEVRPPPYLSQTHVVLLARLLLLLGRRSRDQNILKTARAARRGRRASGHALVAATGTGLSGRFGSTS